MWALRLIHFQINQNDSSLFYSEKFQNLLEKNQTDRLMCPSVCARTGGVWRGSLKEIMSVSHRGHHDLTDQHPGPVITQGTHSPFLTQSSQENWHPLVTSYPVTFSRFVLTELMIGSPHKHPLMFLSPFHHVTRIPFWCFSSVPSSVGVGPNRGRWFVLGRMRTSLKSWTPMNVPSWRNPPASNRATSSLVGPNGLTQNGAW